jgi:hypothetical protein
MRRVRPTASADDTTVQRHRKLLFPVDTVHAAVEARRGSHSAGEYDCRDILCVLKHDRLGRFRALGWSIRYMAMAPPGPEYSNEAPPPRLALKAHCRRGLDLSSWRLDQWMRDPSQPPGRSRD